MPLPLEALLLTFRFAVVFTLVPMVNVLGCTGGVQDWVTAGFWRVVLQEFRSVQVLVWKPEEEHEPHVLQDQFSVQGGGGGGGGGGGEGVTVPIPNPARM